MARSPEDESLPLHSAAASPSRPRRDSNASGTHAEMGSTHKELELQRKRARDRKSQQAMRDRTKWAIHSLTEQVGALTSTLDQRAHDFHALEAKARQLEGENAQLRAQNAALQLSLLGRGCDAYASAGSPGGVSQGHSPGSVNNLSLPLWKLAPNNTPPSCLADEILQNFVNKARTGGLLTPMTPAEKDKMFPLKPNLCSLLDEKHRSEDQISNVAADIIRAYAGIQGLPRRVAVFLNMTLLIKWMILKDSQSWQLLPEWLRPAPSQVSTPHSAWIDSIPWPRARGYLIAHPEITLDDFIMSYSTGLSVNWPYDPASVLLPALIGSDGTKEITINPVFEEHMLQIRHWTVDESFHNRFPEMAHLIDLDSGRVTTPPSPESLMARSSPRGPSTVFSHLSPP